MYTNTTESVWLVWLYPISIPSKIVLDTNIMNWGFQDCGCGGLFYTHI